MEVHSGDRSYVYRPNWILLGRLRCARSGPLGRQTIGRPPITIQTQGAATTAFICTSQKPTRTIHPAVREEPSSKSKFVATGNRRHVPLQGARSDLAVRTTRAATSDQIAQGFVVVTMGSALLPAKHPFSHLLAICLVGREPKTSFQNQ